MPPAYVFVVDTSVAEDELRACVASLSQALTTLPEYAQVRVSLRLRQQGTCPLPALEVALLLISDGKYEMALLSAASRQVYAKSHWQAD